MGKRNKGEQKDSKIKLKKKRFSINTVAQNEISSEMRAIESTGNGKNKKIVFDTDESTKLAPVEKNKYELNTNCLQRSQNKSIRSNEKNKKTNKTKQNKRLIFTEDNDEGTEVTMKKSKASKTSGDEEPIDEEIDKFCDELDEEDNAQYDNWVKLLEAKLAPNKKK